MWAGRRGRCARRGRAGGLRGLVAGHALAAGRAVVPAARDRVDAYARGRAVAVHRPADRAWPQRRLRGRAGSSARRCRSARGVAGALVLAGRAGVGAFGGAMAGARCRGGRGRAVVGRGGALVGTWPAAAGRRPGRGRSRR
ncbi:hypothetical protein E0504_31825 [Parafrankia sp. BMG5.11]|nr:hypothetical protein E0504_31825 [Parafrankia sp. BMG5.11]